MLRILLTWLLVSLSVMATAQEWQYAKVWPDKTTREVTRMKLLPGDGSRPLYLVAKPNDLPHQQSWLWVSEQGGFLRLYAGDSARVDSALLVADQTTWKSYREGDGWKIITENHPLLLRPGETSNSWVLAVVLEPIEGIATLPEPISLLEIHPHPKKKNRFLIQTTGSLESIPVILLELGIALAMITTYQGLTVFE